MQENRSNEEAAGKISAALDDPALRPAAGKTLRDLLGRGAHLGRFRWSGLELGALSACAASGWNEGVDILLATSSQEDRSTALCWAAEYGHLSVVEHLLAAGANDPIMKNRALCNAAAIGHLPIIDSLLAAGADVHTQEESALRRALANGHVALMEALLRRGADAVAAWESLPDHWQEWSARALDNIATAVPIDQRLHLAGTFPLRFPAMVAMVAGERRRHVTSAGKR